MTFEVIHQNGKKEYFDSPERKIGLHRVAGPAIIFPNGDEWYCQDNRLHRIGGPAIVKKSGEVEYWENGSKVDAPVTPEVVPAPKKKTTKTK